jgi:hypothetical protein
MVQDPDLTYSKYAYDCRRRFVAGDPGTDLNRSVATTPSCGLRGDFQLRALTLARRSASNLRAPFFYVVAAGHSLVMSRILSRSSGVGLKCSESR